MIHAADYIVPVEIENQNHNVYVIKRPGVDEVSGNTFGNFSGRAGLTRL